MKKHILTFAFILCGFTFITAQKKGMHKPNFTIEQKATLELKKLTLVLNINESQQEKLLPLLKADAQEKENAIEMMKAAKESGVTPSNDEIYEKLIAKMDKKIAYHAKVKKILNADQFEKWHEMQLSNHKEMKHQMMQHRKGEHAPQRQNS